jgi:hypothetical protein
MCLTVCSGRAVTGSPEAVQLERKHLSHVVTFLRQFTPCHARHMALFQLIGNDSTTGTKGGTPCAESVPFSCSSSFLGLHLADGRRGFIHTSGIGEMRFSGRFEAFYRGLR